MDKPKVSEKSVADLPLPAKGSQIHLFSGAKLQGLVAPMGFGVRCTVNERKFVLRYRVNGLERTYVIGKHPDWSVIAALKEAKRLRKLVDGGTDPQEIKAEKRDAATVKELIGRFDEEHVADLRKSTQRDYRSLLEIVKGEIGNSKIEAVERAHIVKMHRARKETPYRANRLLAVTSALFSFAVIEKLRPDNPAKGVKRFSEDARERYLSPEELSRLTDALAAYPDAAVVAVSKWAGPEATKAREIARRAAEQAADVVRLALLTGARKGEILSAQWSQIDFSRGSWTKPSSHTKQKKVHVVPLSDAALLLLRDMQKRASVSPYIFPGESPDVALAGIRDHWHAIRKAAGLDDFRLHDSRHNYASLLASGGASLPMIGRLLGHTQAQTTLRYSHLLADPLKRAADAAGAIITGQPSAEVKQLRKDGGQ